MFFEEKVYSDLRYSINRLTASDIHTWIVSGDSKENVLNVGFNLDMLNSNLTHIEFNKEDDLDDLDVKMNLHLLQLINKKITREDAMIRLKTVTGRDVVSSKKDSKTKVKYILE